MFDELWTAVPVIEAPQIERGHGLAHEGLALTLLVAPLLVGALLEARLVLWAERGNARRWIAAGQLIVALMVAAAAFAPTSWLLAVAIGIAGSAGGVAGALGQGALVESASDAREQAMTRWSIAAGIGDLAAPLLVAGIAAVGLGWQVGLVAIACVIAAHGLACMLAAIPTQPVVVDEDEDEGAPTRLRDALRHRPLLLWLVATASCTVIDEILLAFAALHLRLDRGEHETVVAIAAAAVAAAEIVGLVVALRLLARGASPRRLLGWSSAACAIGCATWWLVPGTAGAIAVFALLGLAAAPLYPIAAAQAYATVPGRAALVSAAGQLFVVVDLVAPWVLGVLADHRGIGAALAAIAVGPLVLVGFACWPARWRSAAAS